MLPPAAARNAQSAIAARLLSLALASTVLSCDDDKPAAPGPAPSARLSATAAKPAATPGPTGSSSKLPAFHTSPVAPQHEAAREPPPPKAKRANPARTLKGDDHQITVSDVSVKIGGDAVASIEIVPLGEKWKFNGEFPVRVALSGFKFAATPELLLRSTTPAPNGFSTTNGGVRLDIPLTGSTVGTDAVTADVRFGICSDVACEFREHTVTWKVAVAR